MVFVITVTSQFTLTIVINHHQAKGDVHFLSSENQAKGETKQVVINVNTLKFSYIADS